MKKRKTLVVMGLLLAVLMLGIGYAAVGDVTLTIDGDATASPNSTFVVKFDSTGDIDKTDNVTTAAIDDDLTATMSVSGLTSKGDTATATFPITSEMEEDVTATLAATVTENTNETYFKVTPTLAKTSLSATDTDTTVTVEVELIKTPIGTANVTGDFTVEITATPAQAE